TFEDKAMKGGRNAGAFLSAAGKIRGDVQSGAIGLPEEVRAIQKNQAVQFAEDQRNAAAIEREQIREAGADRRAAPAAAESAQRLGVSRDQQDQARSVARLQAKFATTTDPAERTRLREQIM